MILVCLPARFVTKQTINFSTVNLVSFLQDRLDSMLACLPMSAMCMNVYENLKGHAAVYLYSRQLREGYVASISNI